MMKKSSIFITSCSMEVILKNEEYHPSFNVDEKHKCWEIFESGLSILNKYLNDDFSMK